MITHIKRSIPDLRSIKHQPLENKESPCGSPKHIIGDNGGAGTSSGGVGGGVSGKYQNTRNAFGAESGFDKETDAVTLSAVQTTSCTCGPTKAPPNENLVPMQIDKTRCEYSYSHRFSSLLAEFNFY